MLKSSEQAALDAQLRQSMLPELQRLKEALPDTAMLYVTHDQTEALALADRIVVMNNARLMDVDTAAPGVPVGRVSVERKHARAYARKPPSFSPALVVIR